MKEDMQQMALRLAEANAKEVISLRLACAGLREELERERCLRLYAERRITEWQHKAESLDSGARA